MERPDLYVVARILDRLWETDGPMLRTHLQVGSNVNYDILVRYLDWMREHGLISLDDGDGHVRVGLTEKGREAYRKITQWISEVVQGRAPQVGVSTSRRGRWRGRRRRRGRDGPRPGPVLLLDRGRLHQRPEDESAEAGQSRGHGAGAEEVQAQGEEKSADRRGDDPDDVVDEIVRDPEDGDEDEERPDEGGVELALREPGLPAEEAV